MRKVKGAGFPQIQRLYTFLQSLKIEGESIWSEDTAELAAVGCSFIAIELSCDDKAQRRFTVCTHCCSE